MYMKQRNIMLPNNIKKYGKVNLKSYYLVVYFCSLLRTISRTKDSNWKPGAPTTGHRILNSLLN